MEQEMRQNQIEQAQQAPLKCPRCNSTDTKFRYFNNHSLAQPRHYCRTCKRLWTVGGSLRDIPVGGNSRDKPNRALFCQHGGESISQPQMPLLPSMVPQNLDVMGIQPFTNLPQHIAPLNSFDFNNEFPNLDAIDSLIQPDVANQTVNVGSADMTFLQDWDIQSIAEQQVLPEQIPGYNDQFNVVDPGMVELSQPHGQTGSYPVSDYDLVQPDWTMNLAPQETMNNFSVPASDASLWDNSSGNATNMEPTTLVDPNDWLDFSGYGPQ